MCCVLCVCVYSRGWAQVYMLYHLETGSFLCYLPLCLRQAVQWGSRVLSPPSILPQEPWDHRCTTLCPTFTWLLGFKLGSICSHGKHYLLRSPHTGPYFYMLGDYKFTGYMIGELSVSFFEHSVYESSSCILRKTNSRSDFCYWKLMSPHFSDHH